MKYKEAATATAALLFALMFALLCSTAVSAQTREDTEAWILAQTPTNSNSASHAIESGLLISRIRLYNLRGDVMVEKAIPLNQVTRISFVHTPEYLSVSLMCDQPCAYLLDEPDVKQPRFLFEIYKNLDSKFPARMNQALLHLIKSYGGRATVQSQTKKPEPF
jgi:hypothetical protein